MLYFIIIIIIIIKRFNNIRNIILCTLIIFLFPSSIQLSLAIVLLAKLVMCTVLTTLQTSKSILSSNSKPKITSSPVIVSNPKLCSSNLIFLLILESKGELYSRTNSNSRRGKKFPPTRRKYTTKPSIENATGRSVPKISSS